MKNKPEGNNFFTLLRKEFFRTEKKPTDTVLKIIIAEKLIKGTILFLLSLTAFPIFSDEVVEFLRNIARRSLLLSNARILTRLFIRIEDASNKKLLAFSLFFLFWGTLEVIEGVGLLKKRRWAEYLIVFVTSMFIPLEIYAVFSRFTVEKFVLLLFNIFLVLYLIRSKRLFNLKNTKDGT